MKPTDKLLFVTMQNIQIPQIKFTMVPMVMPQNKPHLFLVYVSDARPIMYAIIGKERINPPVGPTMDCQPPVKFENTGKPNVPNKMYISVAKKARFEPNIIAASVIMNVCKVTGTPLGSGMENGAITQIREAVSPITQSSWMFVLLFFIWFDSPKVYQSIQNSIFTFVSQCGT